MKAQILSSLKRAKGIPDLDLEQPCFRAKLKQGDFAPLGSHLPKSTQKQTVSVYLLNGSHGDLDPWYEATLDELFTDDAYLDGIRTAFDQYLHGDEWCGSVWVDEQDIIFHNKADLAVFEAEGALPFLGMSEIFLDHERDIVAFELWCLQDGNLDEHGITIDRRGGTWTFDYSRVHELLADEEEIGDYVEPEISPALQEAMQDTATYTLDISDDIRALLPAATATEAPDHSASIDGIASLLADDDDLEAGLDAMEGLMESVFSSAESMSTEQKIAAYLAHRYDARQISGGGIELLLVTAYLESKGVTSRWRDSRPTYALADVNPDTSTPDALIAKLAEAHQSVQALRRLGSKIDVEFLGNQMLYMMIHS